MRDFTQPESADGPDAGNPEIYPSVSPSGTGDERYSEQKFPQVKRIIERFRSREGQPEADRRWTALVTDVRKVRRFRWKVGQR